MSDLIERLGSASLEDLPALLLATKLRIEAQQAEIARLRASLMQTKATLEKTDKYGGLLSIGAAMKVINEALEQKP